MGAWILPQRVAIVFLSINFLHAPHNFLSILLTCRTHIVTVNNGAICYGVSPTAPYVYEHINIPAPYQCFFSIQQTDGTWETRGMIAQHGVMNEPCKCKIFALNPKNLRVLYRPRVVYYNRCVCTRIVWYSNSVCVCMCTCILWYTNRLSACVCVCACAHVFYDIQIVCCMCVRVCLCASILWIHDLIFGEFTTLYREYITIHLGETQPCRKRNTHHPAIQLLDKKQSFQFSPCRLCPTRIAQGNLIQERTIWLTFWQNTEVK